MPLIFDGGFLFFILWGRPDKVPLSAETTPPGHQQYPSILGPGSDRDQELGKSWSPSSPQGLTSLFAEVEDGVHVEAPSRGWGGAACFPPLWALPFVQPPPSLKLL